MKNKMKLWRRAASSVKRQMIEDGKHVHGDRYGKGIKAVQAAGKFVALPPMLFQRMALAAGVLKAG